MSQPLVAFDRLSVSFQGEQGPVRAVQQVSLELQAGQTLGIVGESGCGKSVTAMALMGLLPQPLAQVDGGEIRFEGQNLLSLRAAQMADLRGNRLAMIFQEPMSALNPVLTLGEQLLEPLIRHLALSPKAAWRQAVQLLEEVGLARAEALMRCYPHQLSGGMSQRVMIAMAIACRPKLLIADEPTTALDVTVQAQIMTLLNELKREFNTAIIMITHDLGVVAGICNKVLVMYAGRTMEYGSAREVFYQPSHPYSIGLLNAVPRLDAEGEALLTIPGNPPNLLRLPKGCPFQPRCPYAMEQCASAPPLEQFGEGRLRACFKPVEALV
ncbi:ATP-binding cassette domain-containing protein [Serratia marcescens]|uniref:oligopeptide/dipeptide ABC transporter ATP-binding protein n=1 Tax=Serratia marcescens TaxID=615 RepID=UPI000F7DFA7C|nr:oligopeptide/dipeptide ABC transporter ATP-binding protein [Serratia marcescens]RTG15450.1 ATP-binding cassette domain-containing protein [Serratia marcescens]RTG71277.1 ATP-binding cassette domain-containing protein [Serratia marcescens]